MILMFYCFLIFHYVYVRFNFLRCLDYALKMVSSSDYANINNHRFSDHQNKRRKDNQILTVYINHKLIQKKLYPPIRCLLLSL